VLVQYLGDTTATPRGPGISSADDGLGSVLDRPCSLSGVQAGVYAWLFVLALVYLLLAVYLDNVVPDADGVRKPLFFFLSPSFWTGKASHRTRNIRGSERQSEYPLPPL